MSEPIGALRAEVSAGTATFEKDMGKCAAAVAATARQMEKTARTFSQLGDRFNAVGRTLSLSLTAPLGLAAAAAVKTGISFESAFAGVRKTLGDIGEDKLAKLSQGIRDLTKEIPSTAEGLAKIAETGGALGIADDQILEFTRVVQGMAVATNLTADQAANDFARIATLTQLPAGSFEALGSTIVALGNKGESTESEITSLALRIASAGTRAGIAAPEVLGFAAAIANTGIEAEAGGTAFSQFVNAMAKAVGQGGAGLETFAAIAGVSAQQFAKSFREDASGAITHFIKEFAKLDAAGQIAALEAMGLEGARVGDMLGRLALSGEKVAGALKIAGTAFKENTALSAETAERYKTTESRLQILGERFRDVGRTISTLMKPAVDLLIASVEKLIPAIERWIKSFQNLPQFAQIAAGAVVLAAAFAGPLFLGIGAVSQAMGEMIRLQALLVRSAVWTTLATQITAVGASLKVLSATLSLSTIAPAAAAAGVTIKTALLGIGLTAAATGVAAAQLGRAFLEAGDKMAGMNDPVREHVREIGLLSGAWTILGDLFRGAGPWLTELGTRMLEGAKNTFGFKQAAELLEGAFKGLATFASALGEGIYELGRRMYEVAPTTNQAELQTRALAAASKIAGTEIKDYDAAVRILNSNAKLMREEHAKGAAAAKGHTAANKDGRTEAEKKAAALAAVEERLKAKKEADKLAAQETRRHAAEMKKLGETLTGADVVKRLSDLAQAIASAGGLSKVTAPALEDLGRELEGMGVAGTKSALGLAIAAEQLRRLAEARKALPQAGLEWMGNVDREKGAERARKLEEDREETERRRMNLLIMESDIRDALYDQAVREHLIQQAINDRMKDRQNIMGGVAAILRGIGGEFAKIGEGLEDAGAATEQFLNAETWSGVVNGILGVVGAFKKATESASTFQRALGGALVGAEFGGQIGKAIGGPMGEAIGSGIGAALGGIAGALRKPQFVQVMESVGREWGVKISEGLAKQIVADGKQLGDMMAATLKNLPAIFKEAGGVKEFGLDKATAATRDLFSMIQTGKLTVKEAGEAFNEAFGMLAAESIDKTTGLARTSFLELIDLSKQFGLESAEVNKFLADQAQSTIGSLTEVFKTATIDTAAEAAGFGAAVAAQYDELRARGLSAAEAMAQIQPAVEALRLKLEEAGLSGGAAFDVISHQASLATNEVTGPLISGIGAAAGAMAGLKNQGILTQEMFGALAGTVGENYNKLIELGEAGPAALGLISGDLQTVWELQQDFGYAVDESTQKLLDEAEAAGVVGDAHRSAQEQMTQAVERLNVVLEALARKMGVELPNAARSGAQGIEDAFGNITIPPLSIPYKYEQQGGGIPGDPDLPGGGLPGGSEGFRVGGIHDFGRESLALMHGREAVVPLDGGPIAGDVQKLLAGIFTAGKLGRGEDSGAGSPATHVYIGGEEIKDFIVQTAWEAFGDSHDRTLRALPRS